MKNFKKIITLFLSALLITLCGCQKNVSESSSSPLPTDNVLDKPQRNYMTLLYSSSDSFNPYTAKTESNRQLCKLLYEPLIKLDNNFNVSYSLAETTELNGKTCTVTIKNVLFSDGTTLTAEDVAHSFKLAKASSSEYAHKLYVADSVTASNSKTVVFKLNKADPYFVNLLDFPILKKGSENRTDSDSVVLPPIGSGRYLLDNTLTKLLPNTKSNADTASYGIKEINLINAPDSESLSHYVEVGATDIYYSDISDGKIVRMSGEKLNININHLVYIGINSNNDILANNEIRQAISSGIDRTAVCRDGYYNNAVAATGFYNPIWEPAKSVQNIEITANEKITIENLEKIGYNSLDKNSVRKNKNGTKLQFNLLVNKENRLRVSVAQIIASKLSSYGIKLKIVEKPYNDYLNDLKSGNFQLYLGEVYLTPNMDLSNLIKEGGSAAYGIKKNENDPKDNNSSNPTESEKENNQAETPKSTTASELIEGLYNGKNTIADIASVLQTELPFIPICYRTGVLFYNDNIENVKNCSISDIYFSIKSYKFKTK